MLLQPSIASCFNDRVSVIRQQATPLFQSTQSLSSISNLPYISVTRNKQSNMCAFLRLTHVFTSISYRCIYIHVYGESIAQTILYLSAFISVVFGTAISTSHYILENVSIISVLHQCFISHSFSDNYQVTF